MSNASTSSGDRPLKLSAILELEDSCLLAGDVFVLNDGNLQMEEAQALDNPMSALPTIAPGAHATLELPTLESENTPTTPLMLRVVAQQDHSITLRYADPEDGVAIFYRELLANQLTARGAAAAISKSPSAKAGSAREEPSVGPSFEPRENKSTAAAPKGKPELSLDPLESPNSTNTSKTPEQRATEPNTGVTGGGNRSVEYGRLLNTVQTQSLEELSLALPAFLSDLTASLLQFSSASEDEDEAVHHREAALTLKRTRSNVEHLILEQLTDYFRDLTPLDTDDQLWQYNIGSADNELNVIDLEEFEEFLAIDRMVSVGEDLYKVTLEALTIRVAELIKIDPNKVRLPIHVRQLCRAFQRSLIEVKIPHEAFSHIFDYFGKRFVTQLDGFYDPLNTLLAQHHIQPNIELDIQNHGFILARNKPFSRPYREKPRPPKPENGGGSGASSAEPGMDQLHQRLGEQLTGALGQASPDNLYRSVVDALNFKREAEGLADGRAIASGTELSGTWEGGTVASSEVDQATLADAQSIAKALSALQRDSGARDEIHRGDSLREYLASNKDSIGDLRDTSGLTAESLNQLDMVDNLFGTIKSQLDVSADLKPALGNLQIPLAKLALLDPRFFVDYTHSARSVVDKLSHLASSANFPNKALETRINTIVDSIVDDYENDDSVFTTALEKIDRLVAQQERALLRNIDRVVRTQEGQEKLANAKQAVGKLISSRLTPPSAPKIIIDLIENGWRDLLVLTHVKQGAESSAWEEQTKILETLSRWLRQQQRGELDEELNIQRSLEAEPLLDLIGQQISSALPTNVAHEPVLHQLGEILSGSGDVEMAPVRPELANLAPEPGDLRSKIEDLPRLRRWVKRVEQLAEGNWLAYRDKQNNKKRMQLAWISPAKDRFLFVNERGQKVGDLSAIQLARQLSRGVKPPAMTDNLNVVDQSMYHTLEHVQKTLSFGRNHDALTRLINRETFVDQMGRALRHSQRKRSQHSVLYLNIDQFHLVNEVYDRVIGDQVLLEFAKLLAQLHGKKSSSSRMQDDEFAVLLLDRNLAQGLEIAEKIRSDIASSSMDIEGENVSFTVSIGVAAIVEYGPAVEETLEAARAAMLHAKHQGRNQVAQYEEDLTRAGDYKHEKDRIREDLEDALATERFILRAQPIVQTSVSNSNDTSQHYELLLGLTNKDGSVSSPQEFIQSAERYGFMTLVDRWVVREAFSWISGLMDAQKVVPSLAINLSGSSVTDDSFMEYLLEQISEFGVGTSRLCFEITETGTISNLVKAADFVRAFRNIGCKFSIDDFGTGLASHNYLRELPVDYVKIDGSFVTGIHRNRSDYAMARSINDLAHFLGQETIAESVENNEIVVKLEEIGVDYLQGWGVGKPKPLTEVTADLLNLEK